MDIEQTGESLVDTLQDWTPPSLGTRLVEVAVVPHSLLVVELCQERTLERMLDRTGPEVAPDLQIVGYAGDLGKSKNELLHSIEGDRVSCWRRNVLDFELVKGHVFDRNSSGRWLSSREIST